ncbi:Fic family protein [Candidatus Kaiserbacteria bacterium]|nr:Fic family protein [Candidatus Kaiserbacteria bacterium]
MHQISETICLVYKKLHKEGHVNFPLYRKQRLAIDSVVKTVNANYFGVERFPTAEDRAVAYLCFIINDHPVTDGNKRLSILWFEIYCQINDLKPDTSEYGLDVLAVGIEKTDIEMDQLIQVVKSILFI